MSIVIEGCDLTGKSTLAKDLHWPIIEGKGESRGRDTLTDCLNMKPGYYTYVRWWMTEFIYDRALRHQNICTEYDMWRFKLLAEAMGTVIIHLQEPFDVLNLRHETRGDKHSLHYLKKIYEGYQDFFGNNYYLPPVFSNLKSALRCHHIRQQQTIKWVGFDVPGVGFLKRVETLFFTSNFEKTTAPIWQKYRFQRTHFSQTGQGDWRGLINFLNPKNIVALDKESDIMLKGITHECFE